MSLTFTYHSPTTPGNPGFSIPLGLAAVRLGDIPGLQTEAELGSVATSALRFDDPTGTAGNSGDAILGLKQLSVTESAAPAGNRRIGEYYIGDRRYYRGVQGSSPSLRTAAARVIDMTLVDINSFLSFRILRTGTANGSNTGFNRPAETDVQRVTALLAVPFLADTLFDGLVSTANPVNMDAVDYTGQRPSDVLNDCAQQSGKNYFVFYDEAGTYAPNPGDFALFYDSNDSSAYLSTLRVSNVLTDVDNAVTWAPLEDAVLTRDPSRVVAGVFIQNGSDSVYREQPTTAYKFGWRDGVTSSPDLKTITQMQARADRYLSENATEDDRLTLTIRVPAANVNDWREGQAAQVRLSHMPGYESFRYVRALTRTVMQDEATDAVYKIRYECTPQAPKPVGAFHYGSYAVPTLPQKTTPGNLLVAVITIQRTIGVSGASQPRFADDPVGPQVPPFPGLAGWTVDEQQEVVTTTAGPTPATLLIAHRFVQPGESTTQPMAVSGSNGADDAHVWLWEFGTTTPPGATTGVTSDTVGGTLPGGVMTVGSALTGFVLGAVAITMVDFGLSHAAWLDGNGTRVPSGTTSASSTTGRAFYGGGSFQAVDLIGDDPHPNLTSWALADGVAAGEWWRQDWGAPVEVTDIAIALTADQFFVTLEDPAATLTLSDGSSFAVPALSPAMGISIDVRNGGAPRSITWMKIEYSSNPAPAHTTMISNVRVYNITDAARVEMSASSNDPTIHQTHPWVIPGVYIYTLPAGGTGKVKWYDSADSSTATGWAGVAVVLNGVLSVPAIPFPANQVGP